jgi:hypothetical protein
MSSYSEFKSDAKSLAWSFILVRLVVLLTQFYILLGAIVILALVLPIVRLIGGKNPSRDLAIKKGVIYGLGGSLIILVFIGFFNFVGTVWNKGKHVQVRSDVEVEQVMEKYNRENKNNFRKPRYINQD